MEVEVAVAAVPLKYCATCEATLSASARRRLLHFGAVKRFAGAAPLPLSSSSALIWLRSTSMAASDKFFSWMCAGRVRRRRALAAAADADAAARMAARRHEAARREATRAAIAGRGRVRRGHQEGRVLRMRVVPIYKLHGVPKLFTAHELPLIRAKNNAKC